jgi:hypothetical protein
MKIMSEVHIFIRGLFLTLILSGIIFQGCKKDDNNMDNDPETGEGMRLSGWKYYENGEYLTNVTLSYLDSRLTGVSYYDAKKKNTNALVRKMTVEYTGTTATLTDFWADGGGGFVADGIKVISFDGPNVVEISEFYFNGTEMVPDFRFTYSYTANLISETIQYLSDNTPHSKYINHYTNDRITQSDIYLHNSGEFYLHGKTFWHYEDDRISMIHDIVLNGEEWVDYSKSEFSYDQNRVFTEDYEYIDNSWELEDAMEIILDGYGNTLELIYNDSWGDVIRVVFLYSPGSGNFDEIMLYPDDKFIPYRLPFK